MVTITILECPDKFGRTVEIDCHPPAGPVIRLTASQWDELLREARYLDAVHSI